MLTYVGLILKVLCIVSSSILYYYIDEPIFIADCSYLGKLPANTKNRIKYFQGNFCSSSFTYKPNVLYNDSTMRRLTLPFLKLLPLH